VALWFGSIALALYLLLVTQVCLSRHAARLPAMPALEDVLLLIGLCFHAVALFAPLLAANPLHFGAAETLSMTAWLSLAIYLLAHLRLRIEGLQTVILSFASLFLLLGLLLPAGHALTYPLGSLARLHFILALFSYGLFANAAALALLMRRVDRALHRRNPLLRNLPPLLTLEKLLFLCVGGGFILLSLALLTGAVFSEGRAFVWPLNHKALVSLASWLVFACLLAGRYLAGWRGLRAANWTLAGFALLLMAYLGARLLVDLGLQA
jgi:ABC-type uncharacterized transport system permease subunit